MGTMRYAGILALVFWIRVAGAQSPALPLPFASSPAAPVPAPARQPEAVAPGAPAIAPQALGLGDFEAMALRSNPSLGVASARLDAARGQWQQVGLYPNPSGGYLATEVGNDGRGGQQGAYVSQEFVTGGKLRLSRAAAAQEIERLSRELDAQRLRVINDVKIEFYTVLIAQRRLELTAQLFHIGQQQLSVTEQLLRGKEASLPDLLQSRIEANTARITAENAKNTHWAAWRRLAAVSGAPGMAPIQLTGSLEADLQPLIWEDCIHRLLASSPEIAAAQANIRRAEFALQRARREPIPNVSLLLSDQYDNASGYSIVGIQAGMPFPIWNRNQGGILNAEADLTAAHSNAQRVQLELTHQLAAVFERYANTRQQVDVYVHGILPDAKQTFDLMSASYRAGEASFLMLLTAQRTFFQTNLAYLDALRALRENTVLIDGMLLSESLANRDTAR